MDLLRIIAGRESEGWIEVRWFPTDKSGARQDWYPVGDVDQAAIFIAEKASGADVFVGCAPRQKREGGKAAITRAWCLWADLDTPASVEALSKFRPLPTLVIRSGTGSNMHAYWALENPAPARWIERANRRLACALGADPRCAEVARILRPPGTLNHKHSPPAAVERVAGTGTVQPFLMVASLPDPPMRARSTMPPRTRTGDPLLGISAQEYVPRLAGRDVDSKGFAQCPLHEDWNPSLMAYEAPHRGWHCFQCGEGGTVYDFGAAIWDMPLRGAGFVQLRERLERELL